MERHVRNAQAVAQFLEAHPKTAWVSYAGLRSSPHHGLARKYLPQGAGSVFTFGLRGGYEAGIRMVEACNILSHLANIGDTRSLILHPASTTQRQLAAEQQVRSEEHKSELPSLMRNSYTVFCLNTQTQTT